MRPVIAMITDRSRIEDVAADTPPEDRLVRRAAAAARAGAHLIPVRERDLDGGPLVRLVRACVEAVNGTAARVIVNDRLDVALAAGAHGVHLRGDSMPAARLRALTPPGFVVGRSVHAVDEAVRVEREGGIDYLVFGTIFASRSKPGLAPAGVDALRQVAAATRLPVLAVGGITPSTFGAAASAGASGFAAIGLFADTTESGLAAAIASARAAFS